MMSSQDRITYRQYGIVALKLVGVPALLVLALVNLDRESLPELGQIDLRFLLIAVLLNELALWVVSLRLSQIVAVFGGVLSPWRAFRINLQSLFYFLTVPTQIGMEAVRLFRMRAAMPSLAGSALFTTLLIDRLSGAASAAILFAIAGAAILPEIVAQFANWAGWSMALGVAAVVAACSIGGVVLHRRFALGPLRQALAALASAWPRMLKILALSLVAQVGVLASVLAGLMAVGLPVGWLELGWGLMGGNFLMLIPISFAGLGPAEVSGVGLLMAAGVDHRAAIAAVFLAYAGRVLGGLQGLAIELSEGGTLLYRLLAQEHLTRRGDD